VGKLSAGSVRRRICPPPRAIAALERFLDDVPELRLGFAEHLETFGEPLPHVFFGDVTRYATETAPTANPELLSRFSGAIERMAASADEDVENIVAVSFFENLVFGDERELRALRALRPHLGAASLATVEAFERHRDRPPGSRKSDRRRKRRAR
jgi:hypothetical protein